ncbi:ABC transporter transmembrane domain-containing protein [Lactobacillus terrae]|uniref:ABC transporter transmembrane domain-containing protein n=1 Tax=Lactobacillus terrae TaxID=2269374 RepID=UPI000C1B7468|nr:ABC transporter ATP-binding protein [Lactobacillus terrae]
MKKYIISRNFLIFGIYLLLTLFHSAINVSYAGFIKFLTELATGQKHITISSLILIVVVYAFIVSFSNFIAGYLKNNLIFRGIYNLRREVFSKLLGKDVGSYGNSDIGKSFSLLGQKTEIIEQYYFGSVFTIISYTMQVVLAVVYSWYLNQTMTIFILILVVPSVLLPFFSENILRKIKEPLLKDIETYTSLVSDWLSGFTTIKNFSSEFFLKRKHDSNAANLLNDQSKDILVRKIVSSLSQFLGDFMYLGTWVVGIILIWNNNLGLATFMAFTQLSGIISFPVESITNTLSDIFGGKSAYREYLSFLEEVEDQSNKNNDRQISIRSPFIEIKNVDIENTNHILPTNVNMQINLGEKVLLCGESGSGKTTILNSILGYKQISKGNISIGGDNISNLSSEQIVKVIGYQEQRTYIFSGTILENITVFSSKFSDEEIQRAMKITGFDKVVEKMPNQLGTMVGQNSTILSGGETETWNYKKYSF